MNCISEEFHQIFAYNRPIIGKLIQRKSDYKYLTSVFQNIERQQKYCVRNMLLGLTGYESNKQMAIYAIPTTEFMDLIYALQIIFDNYAIIETHAGLGLFSYMYSDYSDKKTDCGFPVTLVHTYTDDRCMETHAPIYYCKPEIVSFNRFIINKTQFTDKICVSIMPNNIQKNIRMFLDTCKPLCMVIVVDVNDKDEVLNKINGSSYKSLCLNAKIISYLDYYVQCLPVVHNHTCTIILSTRDISETAIRETVKDILMSPENLTIDGNGNVNVNVNASASASDDEMVIDDCIMNKILPYWMLELPVDDKIKLTNMLHGVIAKHVYGDDEMADTRYSSQLKKIEKLFYTFINENIHGMSEFVEYLEWKPRPPVYCTAEKYNEYKQIYMYLLDEEPLENLYTNGILPCWITDIKSALLYIYLEYESDHKMWKINETEFNKYLQDYEELLN